MKRLILIALLVPSLANAATYYVDPSIGSDANAGTVCASPIAGYSKAGFLAGLTAGDIVLQKENTTYVGQLAPSVSGTSGNPIVFGVYRSCANPSRVTDGSARAIIDGNNAVAPVISIASRTDITVDGLNVKGTNDASGVACQVRAQLSTRITVRYSAVIPGTGTDRCGFTDNRGTDDTWEFLTANGQDQSGFLIYGPTGSTATRITIQDSNFDNNNTDASSNHAGIKWGPDDATPVLTGAVIRRNSCSNNNFLNGNGIRSSGAMVNADISYNTCNGNKYGIYLESATDTEGTGDNYTGTVVHHNTTNANSVAGIQHNRADFVTHEYNVANQNGADTAVDFGRGIEIVGTTANHARWVIVRFNTANGNLNYIGNGTEGVGLAFDNYTDDSLMYGNYAESNEGNGIQAFICLRCKIIGNVLVKNGTNFRAGVGAANNIRSDLSIGSSSTTVLVANNTISNNCTTQARYGISESNTSTSTGVSYINNVIIGACVGSLSMRSGTTQNNNAFWGSPARVLNAADDTALADGSGAVTTDPLLVSQSVFKLQAASPLKMAGAFYHGCIDVRGRICNSPPDIGAYQSSAGDPAVDRLQSSYTTDGAVYAETVSVPVLTAAGSTISDARFRTPVTRLTDSNDSATDCMTVYSNAPSFNVNSTKVAGLCTVGFQRFKVWDWDKSTNTRSNGRVNTNLVSGIQEYGAQWSRTTYNKFYTCAERNLYEVTIPDGSSTVWTNTLVKDLSVAIGGTGTDYCEQISVSNDDDIFAMHYNVGGTNTGYLVYKRSTDQVLLNVNNEGTINEVEIDKSGKYLVSRTNAGDVYVWNLNGTPSRTTVTNEQFNHRAMGYGMVVSGCSSQRLCKRSLADPNTVTMLTGSVWSYANQQDHFSMVGNSDEWLLSCRYDANAGSVANAYDNECLQIKTDGSGSVRRFVHHRSKDYASDYDAAPKANLSPDGRYFAFTSNWNGADVNARNDVYIADMNGVLGKPRAPLNY